MGVDFILGELALYGISCEYYYLSSAQSSLSIDTVVSSELSRSNWLRLNKHSLLLIEVAFKREVVDHGRELLQN